MTHLCDYTHTYTHKSQRNTIQNKENSEVQGEYQITMKNL